jgi:DNA-binding CsgD family transcriptional regulator
MNQLQTEIKNRITTLIRPLRSDEQLSEVLRKRLTKKEYKLLKLTSIQNDTNATCAQLNIDEEQYTKLNGVLTKKLNQEKLKQEMCS